MGMQSGMVLGKAITFLHFRHTSKFREDVKEFHGFFKFLIALWDMHAACFLLSSSPAPGLAATFCPPVVKMETVAA